MFKQNKRSFTVEKGQFKLFSAKMAENIWNSLSTEGNNQLLLETLETDKVLPKHTIYSHVYLDTLNEN